MELSVAVFVYVLSSIGANQLQVLYKFFTESVDLKCIPSNFSLEICRSFRTTSQKFALESFVLAYHTVDKDHTKIL